LGTVLALLLVGEALVWTVPDEVALVLAER
jgi:hypothetical protein